MLAFPARTKLSRYFGLAAAWLFFGSCLVAWSERPSVVVIQAVRGNQNHLFVPISLAGAPRTYWCVDTGAPNSNVLENVARQAKLNGPPAGWKLPSFVLQSGKRFSIVQTPNLDCDGYDFGAQTLLSSRVDGLRQQRSAMIGNSFKAGGILGLPALASRGAIINERQMQIFVSPKPGTLPVTPNHYQKLGFTAIPLKLTKAHHLEALGAVAGREYSFLLDTGSPWTILKDEIRTLDRVRSTPTNLRVGTMYEIITSRFSYGKLRSLRLGKFNFTGATVYFGNVGLSTAEFSRPFGGVIGTELLWNYYAIIDLGHGKLYLRPQKDLR